MPVGRLTLPLTVLAVAILAAGHARCQSPMLTSSSEVAGGGAANACPADSPRVPRVKVLIPPPEVVFRYPEKEKHGWNLFHHGKTHEEGCAAEAPCAPAAAPPTAGGTVAFNMNMQVPYMMNAMGASYGS